MVIFFGGFTAAGAYISELAVSNYQTKKNNRNVKWNRIRKYHRMAILLKENTLFSLSTVRALTYH